MNKELKRCHSFERLEVSDSVKAKAKDFIDTYMAKCGSVFKKNASHTLHKEHM